MQAPSKVFSQKVLFLGLNFIISKTNKKAFKTTLRNMSCLHRSFHSPGGATPNYRSPAYKSTILGLKRLRRPATLASGSPATLGQTETGGGEEKNRWGLRSASIASLPLCQGQFPKAGTKRSISLHWPCRRPVGPSDTSFPCPGSTQKPRAPRAFLSRSWPF